MISSRDVAVIKMLVSLDFSYTRLDDDVKREISDRQFKLGSSYNKFGSQIMRSSNLPDKPLDPYVAGGIASSIAGPGAGVVTALDQMEKKEKYNQDVAKFNREFANNTSTGDALLREANALTEYITRFPEAREIYFDGLRNLDEKRNAAARREKNNNIGTNIVVGVVFGIPILVGVLCGGRFDIAVAVFFGQFFVVGAILSLIGKIFKKR